MAFSKNIALCISVISGLTACGGGSPPGSAGQGGNATYTARLLVAPEPSVSPSPASVVVLYDGQFLDFSHNAAFIVASVTPSPGQVLPVAWSSSNANVTTQSFEPAYASPAPTAPPNGTFVAIGNTYGMATVTAQVGTPVNLTLSIPVYHYPSLSLGCQFRYQAEFSFDPGAVPNGTSSDLYATIGSDQANSLSPCYNSPFLTLPGTPAQWHTPYGGVFLPNVTLSTFPTVQSSQWQNTATTFNPQPGVLVFKTKAGLIVKAMVPIGPYEVTDSTGAFPY